MAAATVGESRRFTDRSTMVLNSRDRLGLGFPLLLQALGAGRYGLPCAIGVVLLWLVFRNSYITLYTQGFQYYSVVRRVAMRGLRWNAFPSWSSASSDLSLKTATLVETTPPRTGTISCWLSQEPWRNGREQQTRCSNRWGSTYQH
jgi:hypothetical protein